jgi:hypothetical protein
MIVYVIYIYTYTYTHLTTTHESDVLTPLLGSCNFFVATYKIWRPHKSHSNGHNTWAIFQYEKPPIFGVDHPQMYNP